jgi:hypothetical protein
MRSLAHVTGRRVKTLIPVLGRRKLTQRKSIFFIHVTILLERCGTARPRIMTRGKIRGKIRGKGF